jgi:hypothetical protein
MRRALVAAVLIGALGVAGTAQGKGPSQAAVNGPGLKHTLTLRGDAESGTGALFVLTQQAGFFPALFKQSPDPMLARRPSGDLGPKYVVTYTVPGPAGADRIRQDLYPYAPGGPISYTRPGQAFFGSEQTLGGWYRGSVVLKSALVKAGLPAKRPASGGGFALADATPAVLAIGGALLLGALASGFRARWRRRGNGAR